VGLVGLLAAALLAHPLSPAAPPPTEIVRPVSKSLVVRAAPAGRVVARVGRHTEYGSPLFYAVVARRGRWLGVVTPVVGNGRIGWVNRRYVRETRLLRERIEVDLSRRSLVLIRDNRVVARFAVAIGGRGSPTPSGHFAVTDKLPGPRFGGVYGCCILALSGHQPHPPRGWTAGDYRLAIHGGDLRLIGAAVSAGCLHARPWALHYLMAHVPLGTPVTIHP